MPSSGTALPLAVVELRQLLTGLRQVLWQIRADHNAGKDLDVTIPEVLQSKGRSP